MRYNYKALQEKYNSPITPRMCAEDVVYRLSNASTFEEFSKIVQEVLQTVEYNAYRHIKNLLDDPSVNGDLVDAFWYTMSVVGREEAFPTETECAKESFIKYRRYVVDLNKDNPGLPADF